MSMHLCWSAFFRFWRWWHKHHLSARHWPSLVILWGSYKSFWVHSTVLECQFSLGLLSILMGIVKQLWLVFVFYWTTCFLFVFLFGMSVLFGFIGTLLATFNIKMSLSFIWFLWMLYGKRSTKMSYLFSVNQTFKVKLNVLEC